jgi:16S rRNA C1402 (ribose-2'-O) methylase RsmI
VRVVAPSGGSALTSMLSLSGIDWSHDDSAAFTFYFYTKARNAQFKTLLQNRQTEAFLVFLAKHDVPTCLKTAAAHDESRPITAFFDLGKGEVQRTDRLEHASAGEWMSKADDLVWESISDVALLIHAVDDHYGGRRQRKT